MFSPVYRITPAIIKALMSIEADRQAVSDLPIDVTVLASLRETARLVSTHYSTQIEGNRLTQAQVKEAIAGGALSGQGTRRIGSAPSLPRPGRNGEACRCRRAAD